MTFRPLYFAVLILAVLSGCDAAKAPAAKAPTPAAAPAAVKPTPPTPAAVEAEVSAVAALLKTKHPDLASEAIQINRVSIGKEALYEVVAGRVVFYTNRTVDYVLFGNLFLGEGKEVMNFTQRQGVGTPAAASAATGNPETPVDGRAVFNSLPLSAGLNYTYGQPVRRLVIFEDPDCGFCQDFHADLDAYGASLNLQVTVFPFILESKHPNAVARAKALMCTANPTAAWKAWMTAAKGQADLDKLWATWSKTNASKADCPNAAVVGAWQKAGRELGFSATPTIMYENGMTSEGRPTQAELVETLDYVAQALGQAGSASSALPAALPALPPATKP